MNFGADTVAEPTHMTREEVHLEVATMDHKADTTHQAAVIMYHNREDTTARKEVTTIHSHMMPRRQHMVLRAGTMVAKQWVETNMVSKTQQYILN
jgi:hypothetical protein